MKNSIDKKHTALAVACALALGVFSATALAEAWSANEASLLRDSQGQPVMSGSGLCWHSGHGPASPWNARCHDGSPRASYEKVVFDANILFDTDKSDLRPVGRDRLDQFVKDTQGLENRSLVAIGYADRMGTSPDNQVLSRDRVETVKDYLVTKGIAMDSIQTRARGETRPTTYPSECQEASNAKNIACLQPDRHVYIEVSGTRRVR